MLPLSYLTNLTFFSPQKSSAELLTAYQYLRLLRQNLERARIILELVRKREKLKLERLRAFALAFELEHLPVMADLRYLLNYLREYVASIE